LQAGRPWAAWLTGAAADAPGVPEASQDDDPLADGSTARPTPPARVAQDGRGGTVGSQNENVVPRPGVLAHVSSPPRRSTKLLAMARP